MDVSEVRRLVRDVIERARHTGGERRARNDAANRVWIDVRDQIVVPACRQVAQVLRSEGYPFQVSTPGETVRLSSEKSPEDVIELALDTTGAVPALVCRVQHTRGREIRQDERVVAPGVPMAALTDEQVVALLVEVLPPFVER
jgi:hypothetical protein